MVTATMKLKDLLLGRKAMTNLDSLLKNRDITLPTKVCLVKAMVFPVVRDGGAWWAAISGVTQSRTRLNRLAAAAACMDVRVRL